MKKYKFSTIGTFHTNHNEDYLAIHELGNDYLLISIMDGCSMGNDSYFASTLIGKTLRKVAKEISYRAFIDKDFINEYRGNYLEIVVEKLFLELQEIKNRLMLEREEMLSTLILGIVNYRERKADILTVGDGLICHNGNYIEYEHDNKPDYLGYHLEKSFEEWYCSQKQILNLVDIQDLSISSDGIFTFKKFNNEKYEPIGEEYLQKFLLIDKEEQNQDNMLLKKVLIIEEKWGLKPTDDLSMIRIIF